MKLTPLDIHHKEFKHSLRGYNEEEVDKFLDEVADEFERLFKENIDLNEKLEAANGTVRSYQEIERTLHNTMLAAQRSAEEIVEKARQEAETILRDAEVKAKEVIHNALTQKQKVGNELVRIKQAEEEFRARFKSLLEQRLREISEISLPEDVNVLVGQTDEGVIADVSVDAAATARAITDEAVRQQGMMPEEAAAAVEAVSESAPPVPEPVMEPPAAPAPDVAAGMTEPFAPAASLQGEGGEGEEPLSSGFVQSLTFGEVESPGLSEEEPEYGEPVEFEVPSTSMAGEREEDIDIEEID